MPSMPDLKRLEDQTKIISPRGLPPPLRIPYDILYRIRLTRTSTARLCISYKIDRKTRCQCSNMRIFTVGRFAYRENKTLQKSLSSSTHGKMQLVTAAALILVDAWTIT